MACSSVALVCLFIISYASASQSCADSCGKSFPDPVKAFACYRGCQFYSLINSVSPIDANLNITAESCVLACREASDMKTMQDICTVGCTLQRILSKTSTGIENDPVTKKALKPVEEDPKLLEQEIINQFDLFSSNLQQISAPGSTEDWPSDQTSVGAAAGAKVDAVAHIPNAPGAYAAVSVRTYSIADDGRVSIVDDLDREFTFFYTCFSLRVESPYKRQLKKIVGELLQAVKRFFLFSLDHQGDAKPQAANQPGVMEIPDGPFEIRSADMVRVDARMRASGGVHVSLHDAVNQQKIDWLLRFSARDSRLHCVVLGLLSLSCVCLLVGCWVSFGVFSNVRRRKARRLEEVSCYLDVVPPNLVHEKNVCAAKAAIAPPAYDSSALTCVLVVMDDEKQAAEDDVQLLIASPNDEKARSER